MVDGAPPPYRVLRPPEIAEKVIAAGVRTATMDLLSLVLLSLLGGAFIGLAANLFTVAVTGANGLPFGVGNLLGGAAFCLGLVLVVVAGAELFTGSNMSAVMALADGKIALPRMLRAWLIVYAVNLLGAVALVWLLSGTGQWGLAGGAVGRKAVAIATAKCELTFVQAFTRGIVCNMLVCLAIWVCYSAHSTTDRILGIFFPITAFVACGFEHSVANMYLIPAGLLPAAQHGPADGLTWQAMFVRNLLPVTLGNILGGGVLVGLVYWLVYCRKGSSQRAHEATPGSGSPSASHDSLGKCGSSPRPPRSPH